MEQIFEGSKEESVEDENKTGLVIQFSGSACKVLKCTETEVPGTLPGKYYINM